MKQKDIALIIVIVFVSAVVSLFLSKIIFVTPKNRQAQVEIVQPITSNFPQPDNRYFNSNSFDPTQLINVGQNSNTNPFTSTPAP
jgi:hypothetical protein